MNIDRIIKLAIEAKLLHESETKEYISECGVEVWISGQWGLDALEKFAALVASAAQAKEREACARVCEDLYSNLLDDKDIQKHWPERIRTNKIYATAIRARGQA